MVRIQERCAAAIETACRFSSLPPEFLAALIANESGGNPCAERFEPRVFEALQAVRNGTRERYGAITQEKLFAGATGASTPVAVPEQTRRDESPRLRLYASSLGLTQIMGYQALAKGLDPGMLFKPDVNLSLACTLLAEFAERYGLDLRTDFPELFRCWNSGRPDGQTHDPEYVPRALARAEIYKNLTAQGVHEPEATPQETRA